MSVGSLCGERRLLRQGPLEWISQGKLGFICQQLFSYVFNILMQNHQGVGHLALP